MPVNPPYKCKARKLEFDGCLVRAENSAEVPKAEVQWDVRY